MKKNILVLTGSPRKNGNSELLADAFVRGAENAGHTVTKFRAGNKKIYGCTACNKCYSKGVACVFNDDFNELAPLAEVADMLVLATPLYWFTFPAQIKAAIDKLYALYVGKRDVKIKETALLVSAETNDMDDFGGIVKAFDLINGYLQWKDVGTILVPNVNAAGAIENTDALAKAENMGMNV